jgi:hypothetical protein
MVGSGCSTEGKLEVYTIHVLKPGKMKRRGHLRKLMEYTRMLLNG